MGLLFVLPINEEEKANVSVENDKLSLISYGLPPIFWAYFFALLVVIISMTLVIIGPLEKMLQGEDFINRVIALMAAVTVIGLPLSFLGLLLYRKKIEKTKKHFKITHQMFGIPLWRKKLPLIDDWTLQIDHFLGTPNLARKEGDVQMKGFENRGYFELKVNTGPELYTLDRSNQKRDLKNLKDLLLRY